MRAALILLSSIACLSQVAEAQQKVSASRKAATDALALFRSAQIAGTQRQCTCAEQTRCFTELQQHGEGCLSRCMGYVSKIDANPTTMTTCMRRERGAIVGAIECAKRQLPCTPTQVNRQVPRHDYRRLMGAMEAQLYSNRKLLARAGAAAQVMLDVAGCVKNCVIEENRRLGGFCFERSRCEPLVAEQAAEAVARSCAASSMLKREGAALCDCAIQAGARGIGNICPLLRMMAQRGPARRG